MNICTPCNGTGKMTVRFEEYGKPETKSTSELTCVICHGTGEIDDETQEAVEFEKNMWCNRVS